MSTKRLAPVAAAPSTLSKTTRSNKVVIAGSSVSSAGEGGAASAQDKGGVEAAGETAGNLDAADEGAGRGHVVGADGDGGVKDAPDKREAANGGGVAAGAEGECGVKEAGGAGVAIGADRDREAPRERWGVFYTRELPIWGLSMQGGACTPRDFPYAGWSTACCETCTMTQVQCTKVAVEEEQ